MVRPAAPWRTLLLSLLLGSALHAAARTHTQDTGFLDRSIVVNGVDHRYVVYLPEGWNKREKWPVILFLHGSGERGSEGLDETQIGLPAALRAHPERWPFIVVMPQVPYNHHHWTDPDMMAMAMAALRSEEHEFHGDPDRTYLTGISLGGYGTWELARDNPRTFAAIAPVSGGIFWSYAPARWSEQATLPEEYARTLHKVPVWMFHGAADPIVSPRQSVLMYEALQAAGGNVRLYLYANVKHNAWDRAYADPALPHWLLSHSLTSDLELPAAAERVLVPVHPVPAHVNPAIFDDYAGEYVDSGVVEATIYREGDKLLERNRAGDVYELLPENASTYFFASGSPTRLTFERDPETGVVRNLLYRDDRHEERWERRP